MGQAHQSARARPVPERDDEGKRQSKIRRILFRARGRVTQPTNMRATAEQRGCDRG